MNRTEFLENLKTGEFRESVREVIYSGYFKFGMIHPVTDPYWMDCFRILKCENHEYAGRTVGEIARERSPERIVQAVYRESVEVIFDALVQDPETTWAMVVDKRESGPTLPVFLRHQCGMPSTDVIALPAKLPQDGKSFWSRVELEPISYGLYPYYIKHFVKELEVLTLEEAVKKATYVPAHDVLKLHDRGMIKEGAFADLVMFDLNIISEGNTFHEPTLPPKGIEVVFVNGTIVYCNNSHTGAMPGQVLRHN
jgi:N-acyl-D-aspartate/D-glutamate deacylase